MPIGGRCDGSLDGVIPAGVTEWTRGEITARREVPPGLVPGGIKADFRSAVSPGGEILPGTMEAGTMDVYIYQADLLCEGCGQVQRDLIDREKRGPEDPDDETTYDSDEYPKGPYPDGGGESDTPNHCGACAAFLENPLTLDGEAYVRERLLSHYRDGTRRGDPKVAAEWAEFYDWLVPRNDEEQYDE